MRFAFLIAAVAAIRTETLAEGPKHRAIAKKVHQFCDTDGGPDGEVTQDELHTCLSKMLGSKYNDQVEAGADMLFNKYKGDNESLSVDEMTSIIEEVMP